MRIRLTILSLLLILGVGLFAQKAVPKKTEYLINDYARLMSRSEVQRLGNKLRDYALETSTQIAVITENSLEGADLAMYATELAHEWGIGGKGNDNGVLIYIAKADRQIRIQTGYGSEGFLPDAMARRIIENVLVPAFRQNDFYGGLDRATDIIMDLGKGEYTNDNPPNIGGDGIPFWLILLLIFIAIMILSAWFGDDDGDDDDGGYYRGGRYDMGPRRPRRRSGGWVVIPGGGGGWPGGGGGGSGGGGFGGFGGGGFGGFGGGGFGGGGAGGGW